MVISVVVPAYNEQENVAALHHDVRRHLADPELRVEIIFVDDGSQDKTCERVRELRARDPLVRLIRFGRNFGQQAALLAGLRVAQGAAVITMDCDLQHPAELLPRMVAAWKEGAAIVQTVRVSTVGANWFKRSSSRMFYALLRRLTDAPVPPGAADYQLLDRQLVDLILRMGTRRPFLRGLVGWLGFPVRRIEYVAPPRRRGASSYRLVKMFELFLDGVTALSAKPLRLAYLLGLFAAVVCLAYAAFAIAAYLAGRSVPGWTSIVMVVVFLGAVQLLCLGIVGEYVGRIYDEVRRLPPFVIVEEEGGAAPTDEIESTR